MAFIIVVIFIGIALLQVPGFIKKRLFKETAVYITLLGIALFYALSLALDWNIRSADYLIDMVFSPVADLVFPGRPHG